MLMKIFNKGQVVIPSEIRKDFGLAIGGFVDVHPNLKTGAIELRPVPTSLARELAGILKRRRKDWRRKDYDALGKGLAGEYRPA